MSNEELVVFVQALDACWMEGRFEDLRAYLADDVVFVAPGGSLRISGAAEVIESYRQFLSHARVEDFRPYEYVVTLRSDTAIIEYRWDITWSSSGSSHRDSGREVLVLARRDEAWRVVWRTQIPGTS